MEFIIYLSLINIISFIIFGIDKRKAIKRQMRISENAFMILALLGGSTGILIGMVTFKHKLSKKKFYIGIPFMLIVTEIIKMIILNYIN